LKLENIALIVVTHFRLASRSFVKKEVMPKIYINCPEGTFTTKAKELLAEELTSLAIELERLPDTLYVRSTVWIHLNEYPAGNVFHGGKPGGTKVISMEVNAFNGALDTATKGVLIEKFTALIGKHAGTPDGELIPVYIAIRNVHEDDWGIFGKRIRLQDIYNPPADRKPI
jgi:phenylpyruvate tautomerase PptA (4-oxalocrotonate tautomerase family)